MVFLKPTPIITAVIIKTLLVLTITDCVFSGCKEHIKELYTRRLIRVPKPENTDDSTEETIPESIYDDFGFYVTEDEEFITKNLLQMFQKGFLEFNETKIYELNSFFAEKEIRKNRAKIQQLNLDITRLNKQFDKFIIEQKIEEIKHLQSITKNMIVRNRNRHTYGYFRKFLNLVSISDTHLLKNPRQFCFIKYRTRDREMKLCEYIIKKKFNFSGEESGGQIFNIMYENWTEDQVNEFLNLQEERNDMKDDFISDIDNNPGAVEAIESHYTYIVDVFRDSLRSFYKQFQNIISTADASQMLSPKAYCAGIVGESSRS